MIGALILATLVQAQGCPASVILPAELPVPLMTTGPLSSKTQVKGDMIVLRTSEDVLVDGVLVIPKGTEATGQVSDARATGGLGIGGRLSIAPLYLRVGGTVVRLSGVSRKKGTTGADTVAGLALTPIISGKNARIADGSPVPAQVMKPVTVCVAPAGS
jgi:hypothetical protein